MFWIWCDTIWFLKQALWESMTCFQFVVREHLKPLAWSNSHKVQLRPLPSSFSPAKNPHKTIAYQNRCVCFTSFFPILKISLQTVTQTKSFFLIHRCVFWIFIWKGSAVFTSFCQRDRRQLTAFPLLSHSNGMEDVKSVFSCLLF